MCMWSAGKRFRIHFRIIINDLSQKCCKSPTLIYICLRQSIPPGVYGMCGLLNFITVIPVLCKLNMSLPVHNKNIHTSVITLGTAASSKPPPVCRSCSSKLLAPLRDCLAVSVQHEESLRRGGSKKQAEMFASDPSHTQKAACWKEFPLSWSVRVCTSYHLHSSASRDFSPTNTLRLKETQSTLWTHMQALITWHFTQFVSGSPLLSSLINIL